MHHIGAWLHIHAGSSPESKLCGRMKTIDGCGFFAMPLAMVARSDY
jgi:hypothetical protein